MPITTHQGDVLVRSPAIIPHGCNAQGGMGAGIALTIKRRFPGAHAAYRAQYEAAGLPLGSITCAASPATAQAYSHTPFAPAVCAHIPDNVIIVNAVTQEFYGRKPGVVYVDYDALEAAFTRVVDISRATGFPVHFPLIGCGLAGGDWAIASKRIERALGDIDGHLWLLPQGWRSR